MHNEVWGCAEIFSHLSTLPSALAFRWDCAPGVCLVLLGIDIYHPGSQVKRKFSVILKIWINYIQLLQEGVRLELYLQMTHTIFLLHRSKIKVLSSG